MPLPPVTELPAQTTTTLCCTLTGSTIDVDTDVASQVVTHHLVIEGPVWAVKQLANEVCALDAAALYVWQAMPDCGLPPDVEVVQLQQQLAADGQRSVVAPHSNLQAAPPPSWQVPWIQIRD